MNSIFNLEVEIGVEAFHTLDPLFLSQHPAPEI